MANKGKVIKTSISGLKIRLNKIIKDRRGYLAEMAPGGTDNPFLKEGFGNLYVSVATQRGIVRGGHYHDKLIENFFTVSGLALWLFKDYRKQSSTQDKTYYALFGEKKFFDKKIKQSLEKLEIKDKFLLPDKMAPVYVPSGVYHAYYPLHAPVRVVALGSEAHDPQDYVRFGPEEVPEFREIFEKVKT